jgi:hypothetical protein
MAKKRLDSRALSFDANMPVRGMACSFTSDHFRCCNRVCNSVPQLLRRRRDVNVLCTDRLFVVKCLNIKQKK